MRTIALPIPRTLPQLRHRLMTFIWSSLQWCGCGVLGLIGGSIAAGVVTEQTQIPIGMAAGICIALVSAAMWLSRKLTHLSDQVDALREDMGKLPCQDRKECPEKPGQATEPD